ncbi:unnamed protein product [Cyprideis torosa]|uniref:Acetyltransferase component of pyruvate dehydrogenase complex n=1 Tax=Cyprideis torosa TaxID=163714 RepID=A0A7R8WPK7_9CRUS|nr:unnamed protein product [Cyprideis torosa]CAG0905727.1 unnamed protein product [Cyprideis torosa]
MEEGNIVSWLKKEGDKVEPGDVLAEVETDKATMDLESFNEGTLLYIGVKSGPVPVDGIIAIIGEAGEDVSQLLAQAESEQEAPQVTNQDNPKATVTVDSSTKPAAPAEVSTATSQPAVTTTTAVDGRVKASPLAKKMASDANINITQIEGSGENGRVVKRDVENAIQHGVPAHTSMSTGSTMASPMGIDPSVYGDKPVSQMRKVIAKRLGESKFTAPHFYLTMEIDMDNAIEARKAINADGDVKISFNDIVVKAAAMALRKHPEVNASWYGDHITYHQDVNIGVAVAIQDGLMVPVVRHADMKPLTMIKEEIKDLATKAHERKLTPEQMTGNTFTISNLGMFGIEEFTAIINPPEACILAVGGIQQKPVVKNGEIVVGNRMKVTMSCDHRVVDGAVGSKFLLTLKAMLENPIKMIV